MGARSAAAAIRGAALPRRSLGAPAPAGGVRGARSRRQVQVLAAAASCRQLSGSGSCSTALRLAPPKLGISRPSWARLMGSRPTARGRAEGPSATAADPVAVSPPPWSALLPRRSCSLRLGRDLRLPRELLGVLGSLLPSCERWGELGRAAEENAAGRDSERRREAAGARPSPRARARPSGACRCHCRRRLPSRRVCDTQAARARPAPPSRPPGARARSAPRPPPQTQHRPPPRAWPGAAAQAPPPSRPGPGWAHLSAPARATSRGRPGASTRVVSQGAGVPPRSRLRLACCSPPPRARGCLAEPATRRGQTCPQSPGTPRVVHSKDPPFGVEELGWINTEPF